MQQQRHTSERLNGEHIMGYRASSEADDTTDRDNRRGSCSSNSGHLDDAGYASSCSSSAGLDATTPEATPEGVCPVHFRGLMWRKSAEEYSLHTREWIFDRISSWHSEGKQIVYFRAHIFPPVNQNSMFENPDFNLESQGRPSKVQIPWWKFPRLCSRSQNYVSMFWEPTVYF